MAFSCSLGLDSILSLGGRNGHSGGMFWQQCDHQTTLRPQIVAPTVGFYVNIGGNAGPRHQLSPQHGPWQQLCLDVTTAPSCGMALSH